MELCEKIEDEIAKDNWQKARKLIRTALKNEQDSHWLLTRLGLTYYEERKYEKALEITEKALNIEPSCPLVRWDYAGCLDMLERKEEAVEIWKGLLRQGVNSVGFGDCGEGKRWAESLLNDCRYRLGLAYYHLGNNRLSKKWFNEHLNNRKQGLPSTYSKKEVLSKLARTS